MSRPAEATCASIGGEVPIASPLACASSGARVLVVGDHAAVRAALRAALEAGGIDVVGEAAGGADAVAQVAVLRPTVALVDLGATELCRRAVIDAIREASPEIGVVVLADRGSPAFAIDAFRSGARGYLSRSASPSAIVDAIRAVHAGGGVVSPDVAGKILHRLCSRRGGGRGPGELSARELEILELLSTGAATRTVAERLGISVETVKSHLKKAFQKLGAADRAHAVAIALRQGLFR